MKRCLQFFRHIGQSFLALWRLACAIFPAVEHKSWQVNWQTWLTERPDMRLRLSLVQQLADLDRLDIDELMIPRGQIEYIDITNPWMEVKERLLNLNCHFIAICQDSLDDLLGMLPVHRLPAADWAEFDSKALIKLLVAPYFIPTQSKALSQLKRFSDMRQSQGFVVDEYGDILGLLTREAIVTHLLLPLHSADLDTDQVWDNQGCALVEGAITLRELNRRYGISCPLDGPKTLNGLILEYLEDIPDADLSIKINGVVMDILQSEDRQIKTVRVHRPAPQDGDD